MIQPTIQPVKKSSTAIAAAAAVQPVVRYFDLISVKPIRESIIWMNPEFNENSKECNPAKSLQDWLNCPDRIDFNSINDVSIHKDKSNNNSQPSVRKARVVLENSDITELCTISLGNWRNKFMLNPSVNGLLIGTRIIDVTPEKTIYSTTISCNNNDIEKATQLIKQIVKDTNVKEVDWL